MTKQQAYVCALTELKEAELIIFDLDGTLVDSKEDISNSIRYGLQKTGLPEMHADEIAELLYQGSKGVIADLLGPHRHHFDEVFSHFTNHYEKNLLIKTKYYPGTQQLLAALKHVPMAVFSNKRERFCKAIIKGLDVIAEFDPVLGGDSVEEKKPHPMGIEHILKIKNTNPNKTWMVGDSPVDVEAAKAAGIRSLALLEGFTSADIMKATQADYHIPHFISLSELL